MNYLVVVAHPDDEVLGAGATIHKLIKEGHKVAVATMANHAAARANISDTLQADQKKAFEIMGVSKSYSADFPNIKMSFGERRNSTSEEILRPFTRVPFRLCRSFRNHASWSSSYRISACARLHRSSFSTMVLVKARPMVVTRSDVRRKISFHRDSSRKTR